MAARLTIARLGQRGEGLAETATGLVFVPYALPGEEILAEVDGARGHLVEILSPSPARIEAFCRYYGICGGCAVQALAAGDYAAWKRGLLIDALRHTKITANVLALVDAHGEGRRRATFHARYEEGRVKLGFMQARAHDVVDLALCPILAPGMAGAIAAARAVAAALRAKQKPLDVAVTATLAGLDIDIRGHGPLDDQARQRLITLAEEHGLARLSNHGERMIERQPPALRIGRAEVVLPPGAFLQATAAGEAALAAEVEQALTHCRKVADLFAGVGTFSLRLAERANVHAVDADEASLQALARAARATSGLQPTTIERRDLFRQPVTPDALAAFDGVVFDPPRAGAEAQAKALAQSKVAQVVAVSCNVQSFARDAAILCAGGYEMTRVAPIDQFRHAPHVEIVAVFQRAAKRAKRRLLG